MSYVVKSPVSAGSSIGKSTDPCDNDKSSLSCICKDSKTRDQNILCNGLFVGIIILFVVAVIVILFAIKYVKSRKNIKIGPAKVSRGKYIEMEDESELWMNHQQEHAFKFAHRSRVKDD